MSHTCDLDHVALAGSDTTAALHHLTGPLGGTVLFGGQGVGFRPMQVWLGTPDGDGMPVELLEPWATERNDFLSRFLARHGDGPHHLTFKVPDLDVMLERARAAGLTPVNIDRSDPSWQEAFLLPREAHGTVVQLAQMSGGFPDRAAMLAHVAVHGPDMHPRWWVDPSPAEGPPARLRRVVVATPDVEATLGCFSGLLDGALDGRDDRGAELVWPGGARLRLEHRTDRTPGIDHLEVTGLAEPCELLGTRFVPAAD